jgi:hypothetical protein
VDPRGVREVEAVEQDQSQQHLLYDPFGERMERRGTFLTAESAKIENDRYYDD